MESRVLTGGATAIRGGLPLLRKPAAVMKFTTAATCGSNRDFPAGAVTAKPVGPLIAGPNLIWGRQLRPAILLEASPKRESIKPCSAAASSSAGSSDSSGEAKIGFFNKATLTTGFFFFMWYFLNVIFNILNKKIYNYFPYPYFVSVIHLAVGVVYCLVSWAVGLPKRAPIDSTQLKLLTPVAFCHALGHVTSNVSFAAVAVSFTHTIKALEPFFNAAASQFILGQQINAEYDEYSSSMKGEKNRKKHQVEIPAAQPFLKSLKNTVKETLFPDDPLRQFKNQPPLKKLILGLQYFFPIFEWAPRYTLDFFKSDLISGITIASLAIPQGISYAKLANLPPILGLYSSFVPALVYAVMGSSRDLAVGTVAVASLLIGSMLGEEVNPTQNPTLYLHLALTATFFAGLFEAALGIFRLGFIVDFLSHSTIVGFMGGAATVVILQQLKGILGLDHFTQSTDIISVLRSVFTQTHQWRWQSAVLGFCFLFYLLAARFFSQKRPKFFWVSAMAPLLSVILATILVYFTHAENHGVQVIGELKKGLNPISITDLSFGAPYLSIAIKTGIVTGVISLAEGIAVGRSFAMYKNYNIDGNKEMIAFGMMNIVGSCTSCYLTTGPFSRSAVNFNAGCKTAVSNIVMAVAVMVTLLVLTPLFHYTPLVVLSSIIVSAMLGLIDYNAAIHLWHVDKFDFLVCMSAYFGVVFASVEIGLVIAVALSLLRVLLYVARPRTLVLGNIPDSNIYRNVEQYPNTDIIVGVLILDLGAPIYFTNASYLRERISRWIDDEEDKLKSSGETLQYVILDMGAVGNIDTSGISMLEEVKRNLDRRDLKLVLANPGAEVMKKLNKSKFLETLGQEWIFLTVGEAVESCNYMLHSCKPKSGMDAPFSNNV